MTSRFFDSSSIRVQPKGGTIWTVFLPWLYLAIAILLIVLAAAIFWPVFDRNQKLQSAKVQLQGKIAESKKLHIALQDHNQALQSDPVFIERKARDVLSVGRKGEVIFKFPPYVQPADSQFGRTKTSDYDIP